jgi:phosphatidylglycerol:prolipoprotein diacylglycerol transferase
MYPNLYYAFKDIFGIEIGFLRIINTFGFFVAMAFLLAASLLSKELRRKSRQGLFQPTEEQVLVGQPATVSELLVNFIIGFIMGFKIGGFIVIGSPAVQDPEAYLFSGQGSILFGILLAAVLTFWKWWEKNKQKLPNPEKRPVRIWPYDRVGEITILALIFGIVGARLFDIFENWDSFLQDPWSQIFSRAGLTFYGGLICATIAIIIYAKKHKISIRHLADSVAPALMIAYAVGRIGCQLAGDGDWGIYNSAYMVDANQKIVEATPGHYDSTLAANPRYMQDRFAESGGPHHASFKKPVSFLPNWFFAYQYPHNVNEDGIPIAGCTGKYCNALPIPVFPTPLYELIGGTGLFFLLWSLRKRLKPAGAVFCLYLIVNGIERFLVETIRVNNRLNFPGHPSQAEVIAVGLVLTGAGLWLWLARKNKATTASV